MAATFRSPEITVVTLSGAPDLLFLVLSFLLEPDDLVPLLLFELGHFAEIGFRHGLANQVAEEDLFFCDLGFVERVDFRELGLLLVGERNGGAVLFQALHGEFVGGFHALRIGDGCVLCSIMKTSLLMRKWWIPILSVLATGLQHHDLRAQGGLEKIAPVPVKPLSMRLISDHAEIEAGQAFTVGILLQHAPHHHSYYKFPGIVGVPTSVTWDLPEGFEAGSLEWPTPEQVDMRGHGAYGYHEDTLLLVRFKAPESLNRGKAVRLRGKVGYMCCSQERCTPGFENLSLDLPVAGVAKRHGTWASKVAEVRAAHPRALPGWKAEVAEGESQFTLRLVPPEGTEALALPKAEELYFFSWNGWTASNEPHKRSWDGRRYVFEMPKHPFPDESATRFQGVIRSDQGWPGAGPGVRGMWVDLALPSDSR